MSCIWTLSSSNSIFLPNPSCSFTDTSSWLKGPWSSLFLQTDMWLHWNTFVPLLVFKGFANSLSTQPSSYTHTQNPNCFFWCWHQLCLHLWENYAELLLGQSVVPISVRDYGSSCPLTPLASAKQDQAVLLYMFSHSPLWKAGCNAIDGSWHSCQL